jgi:hypothetical protein
MLQPLTCGNVNVDWCRGQGGHVSLLKDNAINDALSYLQRRFGDHGFYVLDHWQEDLRAVGIASLHDPNQLVYVTHDNQAPPKYSVILERASLSSRELPYEDCGHLDDLNLTALAAIVATHLGINCL